MEADLVDLDGRSTLKLIQNARSLIVSSRSLAERTRVTIADAHRIKSEVQRVREQIRMQEVRSAAFMRTEMSRPTKYATGAATLLPSSFAAVSLVTRPMTPIDMLSVSTNPDIPKMMPGRRRIDVHVGGRIRNKRLERGLREHDLANLILVPMATISDYENGSSRVDAQHLLQFGSLLGVSIAFFFEGT